MNVIVPSSTTAHVIIPPHEDPYNSLICDGSTVADFVMDFTEVKSGIDHIELLENGSIELKLQPGKYKFIATVQ